MRRFVVALASSGLLLALGVGQSAEPDSNPRRVQSAANAVAVATRGVGGSKHDFSFLTGQPSDVCAGCHVPHVQAVRPQPAEEETMALSFYRMGGQRQVLVPDKYMPGPTSLICLSCHNGTIASSTVGSAHALLAGAREGFPLPASFAVRDHPIGVKYPVRGKDYRSRAEVLSGNKIRLPDGRVECISCHDPHNEAGVEKLLVISNRRSALCTSCHVK